jgi:hypothetical protein
MSQTPNTAIAVIGIDIGKNSFHVVGHDAALWGRSATGPTPDMRPYRPKKFFVHDFEY